MRASIGWLPSTQTRDSPWDSRHFYSRLSGSEGLGLLKEKTRFFGFQGPEHRRRIGVCKAKCLEFADLRVGF